MKTTFLLVGPAFAGRKVVDAAFPDIGARNRIQSHGLAQQAICTRRVTGSRRAALFLAVCAPPLRKRSVVSGTFSLDATQACRTCRRRIMKYSLKFALACGTVAAICATGAVFAQGGGNGNGGSGGGNAHGAATAGMTYHGDPVSSPLDAMSGKTENSASGYGGVSGSTSASGSLTRYGPACGHLPQCNADSGR
jgi:hypothetical protein